MTATTVSRQDVRPVGDGPRVLPAQTGPDAVLDEPVEARVLRVVALAEPYVEEALQRISAEVPSYLHADEVSARELRESFHACFRLVVQLLLEQRDPTPEELRRQALLGARRAEAGLDLADVTRAYRLGFLVVWEGLSDRLQALRPEATGLLRAYGLRLGWLHDAVCAAMEDAYRVRVQQLRESSGIRGRAFLDALRQLPEARLEAERAARAAGLRPEGFFLTAVVSGDLGRHPCLPASVAVEEGGETLLVLRVRGDSGAAAERLADDLVRLGWTHIGVGLCLEGLDGARRSLRQAERAHRAARATGRHVVHGSTDWFACLVGGEPEPLDPVLADVMATLDADPALAATVSAYLSADRNLTHAAARLFVHPNTVAYRIRRLAETTGLDLRTLDGLVRAYTALTLLGAPPEEAVAS